MTFLTTLILFSTNKLTLIFYKIYSSPFIKKQGGKETGPFEPQFRRMLFMMFSVGNSFCHFAKYSLKKFFLSCEWDQRKESLTKLESLPGPQFPHLYKVNRGLEKSL